VLLLLGIGIDSDGAPSTACATNRRCKFSIKRIF